ncbi:MAG: endonuclease domain-containing protein [Cyclobacteriaceae bacterium]|nr:endonuclease domain-containing protein [Cyclobacteriaceae bacterium]
MYTPQRYSSSKLVRNAQKLRRNQTEAEQLLWAHLRNRQLMGKKFRRQHPKDRYITDFYCHECKLVVELDGPVHDMDDNPLYDQNRSDDLAQRGIRVIRFTNHQVFEKLDDVLRAISRHLE